MAFIKKVCYTYTSPTESKGTREHKCILILTIGTVFNTETESYTIAIYQYSSCAIEMTIFLRTYHAVCTEFLCMDRSISFKICLHDNIFVKIMMMFLGNDFFAFTRKHTAISMWKIALISFLFFYMMHQ